MMKPDQVRYAIGRVGEALKVKEAALRERHTKPSKDTSDRVKLNAIKNGDVSIFHDLKSLDTTVRNAFDFSTLDPSDNFDEDAFNKEFKAVKAEAAKVKDAIMFGAEQDAVSALKKFCE